jgi:hypothetical protein
MIPFEPDAIRIAVGKKSKPRYLSLRWYLRWQWSQTLTSVNTNVKINPHLQPL